MEIDPNEKNICIKDLKQIKQFPNYWINCNGDVYSTKTKKLIVSNTKMALN